MREVSLRRRPGEYSVRTGLGTTCATAAFAVACEVAAAPVAAAPGIAVLVRRPRSSHVKRGTHSTSRRTSSMSLQPASSSRRTVCPCARRLSKNPRSLTGPPRRTPLIVSSGRTAPAPAPSSTLVSNSGHVSTATTTSLPARNSRRRGRLPGASFKGAPRAAASLPAPKEMSRWSVSSAGWAARKAASAVGPACGVHQSVLRVSARRCAQRPVSRNASAAGLWKPGWVRGV